MKLVLIRHGQSEWNKKNLFTGWTDVDLSEQGVQEAIEAGKKLKESGIQFDVAFTSVLTRAIKTLNYVMEYSGQMYLPVYKSWRLNERHYGALQGLNKAETAKKYGDEQVHIWRRSYDVKPPLMDHDHKYSAHGDPRYKDVPDDIVPDAESLQTTLWRVIPYWADMIAPRLMEGKNVLIAAHGNSLRAITKHIEHISDEDIMGVEIATGQPIVYEMDEKLNIISKELL